LACLVQIFRGNQCHATCPVKDAVNIRQGADIVFLSGVKLVEEFGEFATEFLMIDRSCRAPVLYSVLVCSVVIISKGFLPSDRVGNT
jgi:hypothetical protein